MNKNRPAAKLQKSLPQLKNQWYFIDNAYEYGYPAETVHFTATPCVVPELKEIIDFL
jgi:hypothetical protein